MLLLVAPLQRTPVSIDGLLVESPAFVGLCEPQVRLGCHGGIGQPLNAGDGARALGVAVMPGCSTPTEMLRAPRAGAPLQKLFSERAIGPSCVKQTLGPLPFLNIVPTSGVTLENAVDYLRAGAFAVGFVNSLFDPKDLADENWQAIEDRAVGMFRRVHAA